MIDVKMKKFLSSTVVCALSVVSANVTNFSGVKAVDLNIPKAAETGIKTLLSDEKIQKVLDKTSGFLDKLDPHDFGEMKTAGINFLENVSKGPLKSIDTILNIVEWILIASLASVGISLFNKMVDFWKNIFCFGKKAKSEWTYGDCLTEIERVLKKLPIDASMRMGIAATLLEQLLRKQILNKKVEKNSKSGLVVVAGCGNSLILEDFEKALSNTFSNSNFSVFLEKVDGKRVTINEFFRKIRSAIKGTDEYENMHGLLLLDFSVEKDSVIDTKDLELDDISCFFEFEKMGSGVLAVTLLKSALNGSKSFFAERGVNIVLSRKFLSGVYEEYSKKENDATIQSIPRLVSYIMQAVFSILQDPEFKKPLIGGCVNVIVDLNEKNEIVVYREGSIL